MRQKYLRLLLYLSINLYIGHLEIISYTGDILKYSLYPIFRFYGLLFNLKLHVFPFEYANKSYDVNSLNCKLYNCFHILFLDASK